MSQPSDRASRIKVPGKIDDDLKEFWVENPWEIVKSGHNLSAYERHRTWMNIKGGNFIDLSFLTGTDSDGDGRCVVGASFRNNGRQELIVRQAGGDAGGLLLYENNFPQKHWLEVSLRGRQSNRLGVGSRLTALVNGRKIVREMYPINSYRSQAPNRLHFGLADATKIDSLEIRWPSGKTQILKDLKADAHIVIDEDKEGAAAVEVVTPGKTFEP